MKLIPNEIIPGNISESVQFLRSKGVLVSSTDSYANIPRYGHAAKAIKQGIWVHLNNQYADALLLLQNPNAKVGSGLTEEQMQLIEADAKFTLYRASSSFFSKVATVILLLSIIAFLSYVAINIYKT
jgi:hypothetical protein